MNAQFDNSLPLDGAPDFLDTLRGAIERLTQRLFERHEGAFAGRLEDLRSALDTAEAVAWCTPFPQLFLPDLAEQQIALITGEPRSAYAFAA